MILPKIPRRLSKSFVLAKDIPSVQWAEENVVFTGSKVSPFPGKLNLSRSAHMRLPLSLMDEPKNKLFAFKWASQTAKTLILTIPVGKKLTFDPSFIHWIFPTKDKVSDLIRIKLDPSLKSMKKVWSLFEDFKTEEKVRDKRTIKEVAGGGLYITGTTANDLKSISVPLTVADEVGEMDIGTLMEAEERQKSYSKVYPRTLAASTIVHRDDEIVTTYNNCECQLEYRFKCRECDNTFVDCIEDIKDEDITIRHKSFFVPTHDEYKNTETNLSYSNYATKESHLKCPSCNHKIFEHERQDMLYDGKDMEWVAIKGDIETSATFGFSMGSLAAWIVSMDSAVSAVTKAGNNVNKLDRLYRNWFNQFHEGIAEEATKDKDILLLTNGLDQWVIPDDTWRLFMGVDNQKDHLYFKIMAFTFDHTLHTVAHGKLYDNGIGNDFYELEQLMFQTYRDMEGKEYSISKVGIDRRGYKDKKVGADRLKAVDEFVIKIQNDLQAEGVTDYNQFCFALEGEEDLIRGEPISKRNAKRIIDDEEHEFQVIKFSDQYFMSLVQDSIFRGIKKAKNTGDAEEYSEYILYINQSIVNEAKAKGMSVSDDYERHMTGMIFDYPFLPNNKRGDVKKWIPRKSVKRIDYLDCTKMAWMLAERDGWATCIRPSEDTISSDDIIKRLRGMV